MSSPAPSRWRTVGPHWSSVRPSTPSSHSPPAPDTPPTHSGNFPRMQMHSTYNNSMNSRGMNTAYHTYHSDLHRYPSNHFDQPDPAVMQQSMLLQSAQESNSNTSERERALQHSRESQRQQQLYLEQLQLTQKLQSMPGSTVRAWYPTFGPAITTTCSDSTIILDNPNHYVFNSSAKVNRQSVGPHWRSIPPATAVYSPTAQSPLTSPRLSTRSPYGQHLPGSRHNQSNHEQSHHQNQSHHNQSHQNQSHHSQSHQHEQTQDSSTFNSTQLAHTPASFQSLTGALENTVVPSFSATASRPKRKAETQDEHEKELKVLEETQDQQDTNMAHHHPAFSIPSHIQTQSPLRIQQQQQEQHQNEVAYSPYSPLPTNNTHDMLGMEFECPLLSPPLSAGVYPTETLPGMDTGSLSDMDLGESKVVFGAMVESSVPKRAKPRLDFGVNDGGDGVMFDELQRLQSGQEVRNVMQECFYNAASR